MKTEYQITIGYRAVINVSVKAETEAEAKSKGLEIFRNAKDKMAARVDIQDDNFAAHGILNMDETWNQL